MTLRLGRSSRVGRYAVSGVAVALVIAACSSDVTESDEYQALEAEVSELVVSQAETERQLAEVEGQLASVEAQMQGAMDRMAEVEVNAEELEANVQALDESMDDQSPHDTALGSSGPVTIFGDGEISCPDHRASDESLPVGTVEYLAGGGEIRVLVALTDAAQNWVYQVELWGDQSCARGGPLDLSNGLLLTDSDGAGELAFVVTGLRPGSYRVNVNISSGSDVPPDPRHREMGTAQFTEVQVP